MPVLTSAAPASPLGFATAPSSAKSESRGAKGGKPEGSGTNVGMIVGLAVGGGLLAGAVVIGLAVFAFSGGSEKKGEVAKGKKSEPAPVLVVDISEDIRKDVKITINGKDSSVPAKGDVKLSLKAGSNKVLLERRGFEPIEKSISRQTGEEKLRPEWKASAFALNTGSAPGTGGTSGTNGSSFPVPAPGSNLRSLEGFEGWHLDINAAQREAKSQKKDLMIAYIASDSPDTKHFLREAGKLAEFTTFSQAYVRLVIDLPDSDEALNWVPDLAQNQHMAEFHGVHELPTIVLGDAETRPFAMQVYDGIEHRGRRYIDRLQEIAKEKGKRDSLFTEANSGAEGTRLDRAVAAAEWVGKNDFERAYEKEIDQWLSLAERLDPKNQDGRHEAIFEASWAAQLKKSRPSELSQVLRRLETWLQSRKIFDKERGERIFLAGALISLKLREADTASKFVRDGLAFNSGNKELAEKFRALERLLGNQDVLSSGTGFVVASSGYMMTNNHVIEGPGKIVVFVPDPKGGEATRQDAQVVAKHPTRDIALIRFTPPAGVTLRPLPVVEPAIGRGFNVAAFGYPLGDAHGSDLKLTQGIISGTPNRSNENMYLLDCRVNPGNSGGPLVNPHGEVVGMVTAKSVGGDGVDSYGMAIPSKELIEFMKKNVPQYAPSNPSTAATLPWEQIDPVVSPSVMMILKVQ